MFERTRVHLCAALLVTAGVVTGCAGGTPSRFYLLSASHPAPGSLERRPAADGPLLGVGPISVPAYLDRPDVVTRSGPNTIELAPFDRWGEPLRDNVTRVLAENLAHLLPGFRVAAFALTSTGGVDYQVVVKLTRLDGGYDGRVVLAGQWALYARNGRELLALRQFERVREMPSGGVAQLVAEESALIGELSREIAQVVRARVPPG